MICVNSASDWGESGPSNLTDTYLEFRRRGHGEVEATEIFFNNPCKFFTQSGTWTIETQKNLMNAQPACRLGLNAP
jgi:hypothetical protein